MLAKTHVVKVLFLILGVVLGAVHSGCGTSSGKADAPAGNTTSTIRMTLSTTTGFTAIVADGRSTIPIRIQVTTGSGSPVAGTPVTFATDAGTLTEAVVVRAADATGRVASAAARIEPISRVTVPTDTSGVAQVVLTSSLVTGPATVTADLVANGQNFRTNIVIQFVSGPPVRAELSASPPSVNATESSTLTVTVTDANNNPTPGHTVTFSLSTNTSGGTLDATSRVTDANGRATVTYTAGTTPGTDTAQAQVSSGVVGSTSLTVIGIPGSASRIDLLVSSPQLGSSGTESVTLTALVRNTANNVVSDVAVDFSANSGGIQVTNGTTDATGTATALLTTGGERSNRVITVTARTGNLMTTNIVQVTGTTLTISGANTLVLGGQAKLTILLRDSGGQGIPQQQIAVRSMLGNTLSATSVTTDSTGQQSVDVTASVPGNDTIQVMALGAMASAGLAVSADNFVFSALPPSNRVALQSLGAVTVHWDRNGENQGGQTLTFSLTRGSFSTTLPCPASPVSTTQATTDMTSGDVTVMICSDNAGPSVISATAGSAGPSAQSNISFVASVPAPPLVLQASPSTIGVNDPGTTTQQSVITAVIRDAAGNLVAGQQVNFSLTDVSGGQIFPASATTDDFGRASTIYTAGASPSAQDGVLITAVVSGIPGQVTLTVARQALFVTLGTGNLINTPSNTQYGQPYSVLVNDANGNPVTNATVELNARPTRYEKGFYSLFFDSNGSCTGWGKVRTVRGGNSPDDADQACDNEDVNRNGIRDDGEDLNNNTILDPRVVVSVPQTVQTDTMGFAFFDVTYAREFTWVEIELEARTSVQGSEAFSRARFFLNGIASDFNNCDVSPPGQVSAFGIATTCSCDERTDPATCPVFAGTAPVTLTTGLTTLPQAGGTFNFTVSGGTQTVYNLSTTSGTLSALSVSFGQSFMLLLGPNLTGTAVSITVTARDPVTGQLGTITLTQL